MTGDRHDVEVWQWAVAFMRAAAAEPWPVFGSKEWVDASGNVKLASAVRAGLCWYGESSPHRLAARIDQELEAGRRADEDDHLLWREVASRVRASADQPSHAELRKRRAG